MIARNFVGTLIAVVVLRGVVAAEPPADGNWLARVQRDIAESEYRIAWQPRTSIAGLDGAYHAPNRAQGLRTYFTSRGIRVLPRTEETVSWEWSLALTAVGRGTAIAPVARARVLTTKNRIDYERGPIVEWYVNDAKGLEQGFTLSTAPAGRGPVVVELELGGTLSAFPTEDRQAIDFKTPHGVRAVRYAELHATDATGRELSAHMETFDGLGTRGIRLVVDDDGAVYPLAIDPVATNPAWVGEGNQVSARFAYSAATAGDVNDDGYSDVIVGAYTFDNGQTDEGRAFVYLGSPSGLAAAFAWSAESNQANAYFGESVATAGDVNGDGYSDVIVGAYGLDHGSTDRGRAYVYLGSSSGLGTSFAWTAEPGESATTPNFGYSVATAGDVNGDGYADVIVGAPSDDNGQTDEGRAYVYLGSASGLAAAPAWSAESNQVNANFGYAVATAGDVNGDGYADVIVGAHRYHNGEANEGRAYAYLGSASGLAAAPAWTAESDQPSAYFGGAVATAGDVNGDGYADVIVGAYQYTHNQVGEGRAFVYLGSATGLAAVDAWTTEGNQINANLGVAVGTAGDVNGDGYADVIVGSPAYDGPDIDEGRALIYLGSPAGPATGVAWTAEGEQAGAQLGWSVATAGDVNGDGYADVVVGAPTYHDPLLDEGGAFVYFGSASTLGTNPGWSADGNQLIAVFGWSVATAGDVNGDGYADVIVGAPLYDNGQTDEGRAFVFLGASSGPATIPAWTAESDVDYSQFGVSVGTAGDVDGDGYAEVIVGAPYYANGQAAEGRVYVYPGSASGLATTPSWSFESDSVNANLGVSVATAGDVNGDGYADVVVGAEGYGNGQAGEGRALGFYGSDVGLSSSPAWAVESNQANAAFGHGVATAGDVNRDGYSDVIVGAPFYDSGQTNEGRAFLYHGGAAGLSTSTSWTAKSDASGAHFGGSVGTAGDVNGDGYSDVIVGADRYSEVQYEEGGAWVYHGSASTLSPFASWRVRSNQSYARLGTSVATAGDVNGDGYSDVIVGAEWYDNAESDEGAAFVYHGSATGLATSPAWTAEGNHENAYFGSAVATAGDVDGDGYADVIVGARYYDEPQIYAGRAFVYFGNGGPGLSLRPRQRRVDDAAPIGPLGASDDTAAFRLALIGRTPFGRGGVRLEQEVKPLGVTFNGAGSTVQSVDTNTGVSGASLTSLASGLAGSSPYHWRLRLRYNAAATPFAPASRWLTLQHNGWQEADLRTAAVAAGRVPSSAPGQPLLLTKIDAATTGLSWGASCTATDTDYEVYEGFIDQGFASHVLTVCSTAGATSVTLPHSLASSYFLVVPRNDGREGSYGTRSDGSERPAAAHTCLPRAIAGCP